MHGNVGKNAALSSTDRILKGGLTAVYITNAGDTWDMIAYRVYNDKRRVRELMEARENRPLLDIEVFSSGVAVATPDVEEKTAAEDLPEWRR